LNHTRESIVICASLRAAAKLAQSLLFQFFPSVRKVLARAEISTPTGSKASRAV
jgi:hypothetical protein